AWGGSVGCRYGLRLADLLRLRSAAAAHRRRRRGVVQEPRGAPFRGRPRRDIPDDAPLGARGGPRRPGRPRGRLRPEDLTVRGRSSQHDPTAHLRLRRTATPAAARPALRRRAHGFVSVLLAARRGADAAAFWVPTRRRRARALDARVLAPLPRPGRWQDRVGGAEGVPPNPAAGVLLFAAL